MLMLTFDEWLSRNKALVDLDVSNMTKVWLEIIWRDAYQIGYDIGMSYECNLGHRGPG